MSRPLGRREMMTKGEQRAELTECMIEITALRAELDQLRGSFDALGQVCRLAERNADALGKERDELRGALERLRRVAGVELRGVRDDVLEQADAALGK